MSGYPKFRAAYLQDIKGNPVSYIPTDPAWAVHRGTLGSLDIYFYESSNRHFNLYSNQPPGEWSFAKSDNTPVNQNGWALNPWTDLPANTVALTAQDHTGIDFVGITGDFDVFFYKFTDHYQMLTDPIVTIQKLSFQWKLTSTHCLFVVDVQIYARTRGIFELIDESDNVEPLLLEQLNGILFTPASCQSCNCFYSFDSHAVDQLFYLKYLMNYLMDARQ